MSSRTEHDITRIADALLRIALVLEKRWDADWIDGKISTTAYVSAAKPDAIAQVKKDKGSE